MPLDGTALPLKTQVLISALDLLRTRGWCRRTAHGPNGSICMLTALRKARALRFQNDLTALGILYPVPFNDTPGRTFAEVEQWFLDQISELMQDGENL